MMCSCSVDFGILVLFFKQKTAYEMRISGWSSDGCSSDLSADTPRDERRQALQALAAGEIRVVFSVDLFNEGIDVPSVDTLLLLRPTDSPTVLLQQLGR